MVTARGPPELPVATIVFALGQLDVTADVPTGLLVLHDIVTVQLLALGEIVHDDAELVSDPDGGNAWHVVPLHAVPEMHAAVMSRRANSTALL
jgi:hypothetical protein